MSSALDQCPSDPFFSVFSKCFFFAAAGAFLHWLIFASPAHKTAAEEIKAAEIAKAKAENDKGSAKKAEDLAEIAKDIAEAEAIAIQKRFDRYKNDCTEIANNMQAYFEKIETLTADVERLTIENERLRKKVNNPGSVSSNFKIKDNTSTLRADAEPNEQSDQFSNCNSSATGGGSSCAVKSAPGVTVGGVTYSTFRDWYSDVNYTMEAGESPYKIFSMIQPSGLAVADTWVLKNFCRELVKTGSCSINGCQSKGHAVGQKLCVESKVVLVCTVSNDTKTYVPFVPRRAAASAAVDPVVQHSADNNVVKAPNAGKTASNNNSNVQQKPSDAGSSSASKVSPPPSSSNNSAKDNGVKAPVAANAAGNNNANPSKENGSVSSSNSSDGTPKKTKAQITKEKEDKEAKKLADAIAAGVALALKAQPNIASSVNAGGV